MSLWNIYDFAVHTVTVTSKPSKLESMGIVYIYNIYIYIILKFLLQQLSYLV